MCLQPVGCVHGRCLVLQRRMWPYRIILSPPARDGCACIRDGSEPVLISAFLPEATIARFTTRIVCRCAGAAKRECDTMVVRRRIHRLCNAFRTVIDIDDLWCTMRLCQTIKHGNHTGAWQRHIDLDGGTRTGPGIHYR